MQKWEYLTFATYENKYRINGDEEFEYKPDENKYIFVSKFGKEGWELVSTEGTRIWIFKRPIEEKK